jgi:hypothetical protein
MTMATFTSPNLRITGPLPRRDILAVCAYLNRYDATRRIDAPNPDPEILLDRLAAAARMQ